jgi:hypothetical protein
MATVLVWKECRALAPVFAGVVVMLLATALVRHPDVAWVGVGVYVLGAIALGALSVGHEFAYDTLGQLLAQPGRRSRLFATKLVVLAGFLVALAGTGALVLTSRLAEFPVVEGADTLWVWRWMVIAVPPLVAFSVAPWLTMSCRSTIAGVVFTLAGYATLWVLARQLSGADQNDAAALATYGRLTLPLLSLAACAATVLVGGRAFTRLEAAGGFGAGAVTLPALSRDAGMTSSSTRSAPLALLLKELRLQQTSLILAGLYVVAWMLMPFAGRDTYHVGGDVYQAQYVFGGVTFLYQLLLVALVGALASAEERSSGTLLWQTLQPYSMARQWAIKVGVVVLLTVALAILLPSVLHMISPHAGDLAFGLRFGPGLGYVVTRMWPPVVGAAMLGMLGLYVSSFSRSSIHALMMTGLLGVLLAAAVAVVAEGSNTLAWWAFDMNTFFYGEVGVGRTEAASTFSHADIVWTNRTAGAALALAVVLIAALLAGFGLRNHRSADTPVPVVLRQLVWLLVTTLAFTLLLGGGEPILLYYLATH